MNSIESAKWQQACQAFQLIWGYESFRPPQGEIVRCLLAQQDALIVMPTGGGKSLCFQLPALLQTGVTIVVSPLVALMENQVQELRRRNQAAALLHSELSGRERQQTLQKLEQQKLRLLYLSPETLLSQSVWEKLCQPTLQINGLILDEAHCLAQWGESFRPAYYRLGAVRSSLLRHKPAGSQIAIAAFTATADPVTQQTIAQVLQLQQPQVFRLNPFRANLRLQVQTVWTPRGRKQQLLQFIQTQGKQPGLVYVRTRRDSEMLVAWLAESGYRSAAYHAGLSPQERRQIEQAWLSGTTQFVVSTNAFGMGVDKPDCRWVAHFHAPLLLSEYVQEFGRAGRDGKVATALMLASEPTGWLDPADKQRWQFFQQQGRSQQHTAQQIAKTLPQQGDVASITRQHPTGNFALAYLFSAGQLEWQDPFHFVLRQGGRSLPQANQQATAQMPRYLQTRECRWKFLLEAFGFTPEAAQFQCGSCDNCRRKLHKN